MENLEFTAAVQFGEAAIDTIAVAPLTFAAFAGLWRQTADEMRGKDGAASALLQRKRIAYQAHFMASGRRVIPDAANITQLPIPVVKGIIRLLDVGEGEAGAMLSGSGADGISVPLHYKLGTPITAKMNGKDITIGELEFQAQVYGDIEDVLAEDGDVPQALALIRKVASPVGVGSLTSLPGWAVDRITVADGVTIMRQILPRFLE